MKLVSCLACLLSCLCCTLPPKASADEMVPGISSVFSKDFQVGAAISGNQITGGDPEAMALVAKQFNSLTPENAMKWAQIQPEEGVFEWSVADALLDFAELRGMSLVGHVLIWHQQTPEWVFQDSQGGPASRELLLERMETHINALVGRYEGRMHSWEVVNEALNDDGSLRQTPWLQIIGDDYIEQAFSFAHAADTGAKLYYNDYNLALPAKAGAARSLIANLQSKGIAIHGAGLQGHYDLSWPDDLKPFDEAIRGFGQLGLEVYITELDLSVLPFPPQADWGADLDIDLELNALYNPFESGLPAEVENRQAARYAKLFRILLANRHFIERVSFWGVNDGHSWKNNWPMQGRTDYPLLFDRENRPKSAFDRVIALARKR